MTSISASEISIHAPVKGATWMLTSTWTYFRYFNPRTREGCDLDADIYVDVLPIFQSTHP